MFTAIASMLLTTSCEKSSKKVLHGNALQSQVGDNNKKTAHLNCMSVAGIIFNGDRWYETPQIGSNYGGVHIAAPTGVMTTDMMGVNSSNQPLGYTSHFTCYQGGYYLFYGTSASAPHVSAVAGLAALRFPDQAPNSLKTRIINRGKPPLPGSGLSCNYLDAYNSLNN